MKPHDRTAKLSRSTRETPAASPVLRQISVVRPENPALSSRPFLASFAVKAFGQRPKDQRRTTGFLKVYLKPNQTSSMSARCTDDGEAKDNEKDNRGQTRRNR